MIAFAFGWAIAASLAFLFACIKIERTQDDVRGLRTLNHSECVLLLASYADKAHEASVLKRAAEELGSPLNTDLMILTKEEWTPDGDIPPVLWLRQRAQRIEDQLPQSHATMGQEMISSKWAPVLRSQAKS